jgi:hypothetical protein
VGGLVEVEPVVEKKKTNTYKQAFDKNNLVELRGVVPLECLISKKLRD